MTMCKPRPQKEIIQTSELVHYMLQFVELDFLLMRFRHCISYVISIITSLLLEVRYVEGNIE